VATGDATWIIAGNTINAIIRGLYFEIAGKNLT